MRPNDFIMNSDYLTLANIENCTFEAFVPGGPIPASGLYTAEFNFKYQNIPQTISRTYIHHSMWSNPNLWGIGSHGDSTFSDGGGTFYERMFVSTPANDTVNLRVEIQGTNGATIPAHTVTIKVFRFKVPNLF